MRLYFSNYDMPKSPIKGITIYDENEKFPRIIIRSETIADDGTVTCERRTLKLSELSIALNFITGRDDISRSIAPAVEKAIVEDFKHFIILKNNRYTSESEHLPEYTPKRAYSAM